MTSSPSNLLSRLTTSVCLLIVITLSIHTPTAAQSSTKIYHGLLKLKETKRVLYVAAHPDDENTRLIAYLANAEMANVAYLSLTRGDGGQNLIGKELGVELGMIRTQELLKARETDGGKQFFSRAIDFGYSRNPTETLNNWDREKLLSDMVWVIRKFQPDVIITRFNTTPGITHGHHTTSAILAGEAFQISGDPSAFPEQLSYVAPWSADRIFWNAYNWGGTYAPKPDKKYFKFPVGEFNPLLGMTYSQIAANSRTMHKSQGFGATATIGEASDFIEFIDGKTFDESPFEGLSERWKLLSNGEVIRGKIDQLLKEFDFVDPVNNLKALVDIKKALDNVQEDLPWIRDKQTLVNQLIMETIGWKALFLSDKELNYPSGAIEGRIIFNQVTKYPVELQDFRVFDKTLPLNADLAANKPVEEDVNLTIPEDYRISQPYWLSNDPKNSLYTVNEQQLIGSAFNAPAIAGKLTFTIDGVKFELSVPLQYRYNDQVNGEIIQPFVVVPEVAVSVVQSNVFLLNDTQGKLDVLVTFEKEIKAGNLKIKGLAAEEYTVESKVEDADNQTIRYQISLLNTRAEGKSSHTVYYETDNGEVFQKSTERILYAHIPNLTYFPEASFNLIRLDMKVSGQTIGYIPGAGDDIPGILRNLGYTVEMIEGPQLGSGILGKYSTVIVGIRAFNVNQALVMGTGPLMEYVGNGGNLIVQYNTSSRLKSNKFGPYPLTLSRDRVTVENSPVKILLENHPVLNSPNKITAADFEGWVQERGLYFPGSWDERYQTPFLMQDPGEASSEGSLLLTNYGKGTYTYSGISWFRLLPAGVPGAIRLFVNLIEQ
jgi:LmbE family N-acetylglucosaminyl deacetylase